MLPKFRIFDPKDSKYIYSGGTPSMLSGYFRRTATLVTVHNQRHEQWTGLTDCEEKEIYEGDICQYRDDAHIARIGVVRYSDVSCSYSIECIGGDDEGNQDIQAHEDYRISVIGNINETPEMLRI